MRGIKVTSERLIIKPKTLGEMKDVYEKEQEPEMKQAYLEMIEEMKKCRPYEEWGSDWSIYLKTGEEIGGIGFKGLPDKKGTVEIGYGIEPSYQNKGYATEAVAAIVKWAFTQEGVIYVQAQTDEKNEISKKVLLKNGFKEIGIGKEGPLFEITNAKRFFS